MEKLRRTFSCLRARKKAALIPFVTAGHPRLSLLPSLLLALEDGGADIIEIGIPFSDPLADGPAIQAASSQALAAGATPQRILKTVAAVRHRLKTPVICLTYWNPVIRFANGQDAASTKHFIQAARASGFSGMVVPDVPVEESALLRTIAAREDFATIFLAAPTSPQARLRAIVRASTGFVYYVSLTGTTGARQRLPSGLLQGVRQLKRLTRKPVCVGFGISTPSQAAAVGKVADGVIVGSALVKRLSQAKRAGEAPAIARRFVNRLSHALGNG